MTGKALTFEKQWAIKPFLKLIMSFFLTLTCELHFILIFLMISW